MTQSIADPASDQPTANTVAPLGVMRAGIRVTLPVVPILLALVVWLNGYGSLGSQPDLPELVAIRDRAQAVPIPLSFVAAIVVWFVMSRQRPCFANKRRQTWLVFAAGMLSGLMVNSLVYLPRFRAYTAFAHLLHRINGLDALVTALDDVLTIAVYLLIGYYCIELISIIAPKFYSIKPRFVGIIMRLVAAIVLFYLFMSFLMFAIVIRLLYGGMDPEGYDISLFVHGLIQTWMIGTAMCWTARYLERGRRACLSE